MFRRKVGSFLSKARATMNPPYYDLLINYITIINFVFISIRQFQVFAGYSFMMTWIKLQIVLNLFFLIENLVDICLLGPIKAYSSHFRAWPETVCQILNADGMVKFIYFNEEDGQALTYIAKQFELIIFIRALKAITLLYEVQSIRIIIQTMRNLLVPIFNMLSVLIIVFYFFSLIGMALFGGVIQNGLPLFKSKIPELFHLDNFNDLFSSCMTLFTLMVVNNWMVQVSQYIYVS